MACTSSKWDKFWLWSSIWPWRSRSIIPQNNRALNQSLLPLWSKFGDPSLNDWWVIARTNSWLTDPWTHTHTHTHAGNDNTRRPKLASCNKTKTEKKITWNTLCSLIFILKSVSVIYLFRLFNVLWFKCFQGEPLEYFNQEKVLNQFQD